MYNQQNKKQEVVQEIVGDNLFLQVQYSQQKQDKKQEVVQQIVGDNLFPQAQHK